MLIDAREVDDGAVIDAEDCILGAGPAGITVCRALTGAGRRVVLVESGGLESDARTDDLARTVSIGHDYPYLEVARLRLFGGSSGHWGGHCLPMSPQVFGPRRGLDDTAWPIGWAEIEPYYRRAHDLLGLGDYHYDARRAAGEIGQELLPLEPGHAVSILARYRAVRFGEVFGDEIARAPDVTTLLHANAVALHRDPTGGAVRGVGLRTVTGKGLEVRARRFVLAMGGVENPRLLLLSRDVEPAGLGNGHDMVGRCFMEHITAVGGYLLPVGGQPLADLYSNEIDRPGGHAVRAHLGLDAAHSVVLGLPLFRAELAPRMLQGQSRAVPAAYAVLRDLKTGRWPDRFASHAYDMLTNLDDVLGGLTDRARVLGYQLDANCEQLPNRDSRVTLSDQRDVLGLPRPAVDWRLTARDKEGVQRSLAIIGTELTMRGLGSVRVDVPDREEVILAQADGGAHHMGTTRMHHDPRRGVVDADCRVHGLANLWVAGSSVFTSAGYSSPTMTIVALSLRLGEHLRATAAG